MEPKPKGPGKAAIVWLVDEDEINLAIKAHLERTGHRGALFIRRVQRRSSPTIH